MNICILSMQRVLNYGSLLQAYSLKKILTEMEHTVSFIDIEPNEKENALNKVVHFKEGKKYADKGRIYRLLQQDDSLLYVIGKILAKKKVAKKQSAFMRDYLCLSPDNNNKKYDLCVIGSDEVFNCMNDTAWGFTSQLFGNVKQADCVITYAASCGFTNLESLSNEVLAIIKKAFTNISAFSVRDINTRNLVYGITHSEPTMSLDPVLIGNFDEEINKCTPHLPKRYCIVYAYHGRISNANEIKAIRDYCHKQGLELVSIGGTQKWIHKHLALSPFEVLKAFKNAEMVITDTFHGTIFSAKYSKHFAVLIRESNKNKLGDLISRLNISDHQLSTLTSLSDIAKVTHDKKEFNTFIASEREKSISYLRKSI